jgi:predicted PurR-regulated permease PerM
MLPFGTTPLLPNWISAICLAAAEQAAYIQARRRSFHVQSLHHPVGHPSRLVQPHPVSSLLPSNPIARYLLLLLLVAAIYFFHSFLVPILAALVIAFASWGPYERLMQRCGGRTTLSASIALSITLLVLVIPSAMIVAYAAEEIRYWVFWIQEANQRGIPAPAWISKLPYVGERAVTLWQEHLSDPYAPGQVIQFLSGEHIGNISRWVMMAGGSALNLVLTVLFILITLFFIYKDGKALMVDIDCVGERVLPGRWQRFSRVVPATVSATVTGMGLIAIGEGVVLGTAYKIAGIESAFALGVITGFMALIPGGAPTMMTLVSLYLVAAGRPLAGFLLFLWGAVELFIVDKTIRPKLVGGPIRLPFLPTFFGLIGGVKTMGMVGLFVGPVLMALLVAVWREWLHSAEAPEAASVSSPEVASAEAPVLLKPASKTPQT